MFQRNSHNEKLFVHVKLPTYGPIAETRLGPGAPPSQAVSLYREVYSSCSCQDSRRGRENHAPVQKSPVGLAASRDESGAESAAAADLFPLDGRRITTVKENGGRKKQRG